MTVFKERRLKYQNIYDKIKNGFNIFTFDSIEEKKMLMQLLEDEINSLKQTERYCGYWHNYSLEWEDPRL